METYYSNTRHDVLGIIPRIPIKRALEIGGGDFGTLLTLRQEYVFETWGVDIRKPSASLDHFIIGSVTDENVRTKLPAQSFDLILANDVLEHVEDTKAFVNTVHRSLKIGGLLALSVPNIRQIRLLYYVMLRGTFPREDAGLFDKTHVRWFCKQDVLAAFSSVKFQPVLSKSVGRLVPKIFANSIVGELLGLQNLFLFKKL